MWLHFNLVTYIHIELFRFFFFSHTSKHTQLNNVQNCFWGCWNLFIYYRVLETDIDIMNFTSCLFFSMKGFFFLKNIDCQVFYSFILVSFVSETKSVILCPYSQTISAIKNLKRTSIKIDYRITFVISLKKRLCLE